MGRRASISWPWLVSKETSSARMARRSASRGSGERGAVMEEAVDAEEEVAGGGASDAEVESAVGKAGGGAPAHAAAKVQEPRRMEEPRNETDLPGFRLPLLRQLEVKRRIHGVLRRPRREPQAPGDVRDAVDELGIDVAVDGGHAHVVDDAVGADSQLQLHVRVAQLTGELPVVTGLEGRPREVDGGNEALRIARR